MSISQRDIVFLKHVLEEIKFLLTEIYELELHELREDAVRRRACLKSIEIIGEASKNISQNLKENQRNWLDIQC